MVVWLAINWFFVLVGFFGLDFGISWIRGPNDAYVAYGGTEIEAWRFASAFGHPAEISVVTAIAVIALVHTIDCSNWRWQLPLLLWFGLTNVLTVGRVGLASMIVGIAIVAVGRRWFFPAACGAVIAGALIMMSGAATDRLATFLARGQTAEELAEFNGRAGVYETALARAVDAPIGGYGYRSGRMQIYNEDSSTVHAHNAFLEAYIGLGPIGLVLTMGVLLSALHRGVLLLKAPWAGAPGRRLGVQYLALMVPIIAYSISETGLAAEMRIPQLCFLVVFAAFEDAWLAGQSAAAHQLAQGPGPVGWAAGEPSG